MISRSVLHPNLLNFFVGVFRLVFKYLQGGALEEKNGWSDDNLQDHFSANLSVIFFSEKPIVQV